MQPTDEGGSTASLNPAVGGLFKPSLHRGAVGIPVFPLLLSPRAARGERGVTKTTSGGPLAV